MKSLKRQEKGLLLNRAHRAGAGEAFPAACLPLFRSKAKAPVSASRPGLPRTGAVVRQFLVSG